MRVLLPLLILGCVVLFVMAVVAPARARRAQRKVAKPMRKAERKTDRNAGKLGDFLRASTKFARKALEKSTDAGRWVRAKLTG